MRNFLLGLIVGAILSAVICFLAFWFWPMRVNATAEPSALEGRVMRHIFDRAVDRQASRLTDPLEATDENLMAGMKFFRDGCAGCHGDANKSSAWGTTSFYPRVPQFGFDPPKRPDWQIFWIVKNGVRYTGMGGWGGLAKDEDLWRVSLFLSRLESLPPTVAAAWKNPRGQ